jgi:hypothetical protein
MTTEKAKLLIDAITLGFAILGGLVALVQWRRDQAWKRAEKLDSLYKEFEGNRLIQIACRVMDWNRGNFSFPDGEQFSFNTSDVKASLVIHGAAELTFTPTQARMRDAYDALLAFFDRLHTAIDNGLVDQKPAGRLFAYWIEHFAEMPEHDCVGESLKYVARYSDKVSFELLRFALTGKAVL